MNRPMKKIHELLFPSDSFRFLWQWMGISLLLHLVTAIFSVGYHSADEQFQILEFLSYKLGSAPRSVLAVEFGERMRPWLQPWIYFNITQAWRALGVLNPFTWALSFRLFASLLGWLSTVGLAYCTEIWFAGDTKRNLRRFCIVTLALIWYFPALHARPSSESLGGSAFLIGISLITLALHRKKQDLTHAFSWLGAGALFGLSFESRFQMGLMIFGAVAWLLHHWIRGMRETREKQNAWPLVLLALGFGMIFGLGRIVDHWGYGDWSFSPWNYFSYNLVRGEVSRYGHEPWWDLFRMSLTESWPLLGFLVVILTLVAWVRYPFHILTWSTVPFFIVHELIAHKELRFFFPIAAAGPVFIAMGLSRYGRFGNWDSPLALALRRFAGGLLIANNLIALTALCFTPFARTVQFYKGAYRAFGPAPAELFIPEGGRDPYEILGTPIYFYRPENLKISRYPSVVELAKTLETRKEPIWLFSQKFELDSETAQKLTGCALQFRTLPTWVKEINFTNWLGRANVWALYRCEPGAR